jgi:hypothetical protein
MFLGGWVGGWMDGWMGGWMDGWMEVKAVLRIAYSNQQNCVDGVVIQKKLFSIFFPKI